ncbi:MAG: hypothetical protein KKC75_03000 [Nanoarchaeota archaeon]|nr:hypothetical protein [Nanoarchaeota archaeon]MBU1004556.1 hypothetical protein [Nanoarchaeota archaeon]MBU1945795.1 hypothetical protein [Nanoarchaeota archaeon]
MLIEIIGFSGMFLILLAFLMNKMHKWKHDSAAYDITNSAGSLLLIIYAVMLKSYPFIILNGIWFIVSVKDFFLSTKKTKRTK